jgi:aldehyde:ferredoxin oxidoreductase
MEGQSMVESGGKRGGHWGRIAFVDLGSERIRYEEPDSNFYRRYGGGGALGAYFILRDMPRGADAFSPENVFVMTSSIVAGVDAPGLSKHSILAKSPLTGGMGESQSVSPFGVALAASGLDAIVIRGRSKQPVIVVAERGEVRIESAVKLWSQDVADAHDQILSQFGPKAHTALIGRAGENLVRYASVVNDCKFMSCRTGLGAVLGSKNLKGVVALADHAPEIANQALADVAINDFWENRLTNTLNISQESAGVGSWIADTPGSDAWPLCSRNFQRSVFPAVADISGSKLESDFRVQDISTPPNIEYAREYVVTSGVFATDSRYGGCEVNSVASLGPMTWCDDLEVVLKMIELTYRFGLDPESLGVSIAWLMEAGERGLIDSDIQFGQKEHLVDLITDIALRRGIGELLAEGCARAAATLGKEAQKIAMTSKGKEIPPHEPRNKPGLALAYAAGPIGPDYCVIEHDWDYSPVGFPYIIENSRAYGMLERNDEKDLGPRKVRQVVMLHRWWSGALESLLFDLFAVAPARYMPPTMVETLIRGITGWDFTVFELMMIGERRIVMMQEFNRREGLNKADDTLPDRFFSEPICEGKYQGEVLNHSEFMKALDLYYSMSGFDFEGWPTEAKLVELELDWIASTR